MKKIKLINAIDRVHIKAVTSGPKHHFFGYYDKCPWDITGRFLLANEVDFIDHSPDPNDFANIGIIDLHNNNYFQPIAQTYAWNWQLGCMLQWLPPDYSRYIIYNDRKNDRFVSIIIDIKTGEKKVLPIAIYSVHREGRYAITLNFARLHQMRKGYGYAGIPDYWHDKIASGNDGIYLLDLKKGKYKLIISLSQLYKYNHISSMDDGKHWINHLLFNPDGSRFCFLHRWQLSYGGMYTRLFTANLDGSDLYCLLDSGNFSHFGWRNPKELLGWGNLPNLISKVKKHRWIAKYGLNFITPVYRYLISSRTAIRRRVVNDSLLLFNDKTAEVEKIGAEFFDEDGHCSWSPDGKWILTDTYPDKNHYRTLIIYNYEKNTRIDIGKFYSLPNKRFGINEDWEISGMRCDLHPRWNREGTQVCIDSVHEGQRQIYLLDVKGIMKNRLNSCI